MNKNTDSDDDDDDDDDEGAGSKYVFKGLNSQVLLAQNHSDFAEMTYCQQDDRETRDTKILLALLAYAVLRTKYFIANGVAFGYIRLPNANVPDVAAHTTQKVPMLVDEALLAYAKYVGLIKDKKHAAEAMSLLTKATSVSSNETLALASQLQAGKLLMKSDTPLGPLLLRDLADELKTSVPELATYLVAQGLGNYSTNMEIPNHVVVMLRASKAFKPFDAEAAQTVNNNKREDDNDEDKEELAACRRHFAVTFESDAYNGGDGRMQGFIEQGWVARARVAHAYASVACGNPQLDDLEFDIPNDRELPPTSDDEAGTVGKAGEPPITTYSMTFVDKQGKEVDFVAVPPTPPLSADELFGSDSFMFEGVRVIRVPYVPPQSSNGGSDRSEASQAGEGAQTQNIIGLGQEAIDRSGATLVEAANSANSATVVSLFPIKMGTTIDQPYAVPAHVPNAVQCQEVCQFGRNGRPNCKAFECAITVNEYMNNGPLSL